MAGESIGIQEYLESYVPSLVEGYLKEKPVANMEGTVFTVQLTIEGERSLVVGITIEDACRIKVTPGGLDNPMVSVTIPEDVISRFTGIVSAFTGRKQYDGVSSARGALDLQFVLPGDEAIPISLTFNGQDNPRGAIKGPADVLAAVMTGQVNGPQAFLEQKLSMSGDMAFLISLAGLIT